MAEEAIGLERGVVRLLPYQKPWPELFRREAFKLCEAFGDRINVIEHMGSTAVPGLAAKPIIDFMVSVESFDDATGLIPEVERLGYEYRSRDDVPDRHFFVLRRGDGAFTHHLSLAQPSSAFWRRQLAFRDRLRADAALAAEYGTLKRELAAAFPRDRISYLDGKAEFVARVLGSPGSLGAHERKTGRDQ